ncbi:MAG: CBS domain-containing protein, partial [Candidatus Altiarchaeota archaeon]
MKLNLDHGKYSDVHGSRERGPREFKHHFRKKEGDVMVIAEKNVVYTHPGNSIKNVAKLMQDNDFRRLPVTN